MIVLTLVKEIRQQLPLLGTRKLMHLLEPKLSAHGIKMGRDQLHSLLRFHEFYPKRIYQNYKDARKNIERIIEVYNTLNPHGSTNEALYLL